MIKAILLLVLVYVTLSGPTCGNGGGAQGLSLDAAFAKYFSNPISNQPANPGPTQNTNPGPISANPNYGLYITCDWKCPQGSVHFDLSNKPDLVKAFQACNQQNQNTVCTCNQILSMFPNFQNAYSDFITAASEKCSSGKCYVQQGQSYSNHYSEVEEFEDEDF